MQLPPHITVCGNIPPPHRPRLRSAACTCSRELACRELACTFCHILVCGHRTLSSVAPPAPPPTSPPFELETLIKGSPQKPTKGHFGVAEHQTLLAILEEAAASDDAASDDADDADRRL